MGAKVLEHALDSLRADLELLGGERQGAQRAGRFEFMRSGSLVSIQQSKK